MLATSSTHTLGTLLTSVITGKTLGRNFYLAMIESFVHLPTIAQVWRSLLFEESRLLERLKAIQSVVSPLMADQPVETTALERAREVQSILSDDRIRSIRTLEDAHRLACEYEATGLQDIALQVTGPFYPHLDGARISTPPPLGTQHRIASMAERFGNPSIFPLVLVYHDHAQP